MKHLIIGLALLISPILLLGHNPLSARYYLETGDNASILSINLSQQGVNQILSKQYSKEVLQNMDQKRYKEVIVDYIKKHFYLTVNKERIQLKEGGIRLGSHQTDLKFVLPPLAEEMEELDIHIPAFKENKQHQTIFAYDISGKVDKVILSINNDYQATVSLTEQQNSQNWLWVVLVGLSFLIYWLYLRQSYQYDQLVLR